MGWSTVSAFPPHTGIHITYHFIGKYNHYTYYCYDAMPFMSQSVLIPKEDIGEKSTKPTSNKQKRLLFVYIQMNSKIGGGIDFCKILHLPHWWWSHIGLFCEWAIFLKCNFVKSLFFWNLFLCFFFGGWGRESTFLEFFDNFKFVYKRGEGESRRAN